MKIECKNLSKIYKNESEIRYPDFVFESGKSYLLLGTSGCGKSTLLNMIAGVLSPSAGQILIDEENAVEWQQKKKDLFRIQNIGYIYQDFKLIDEMTVLDNIDILRLEHVDTAKAPKLLEKLGIEEQKNKRVKHLSGGQKQRVAIVRALVKNPAIVLADEPTGNLNFEIGAAVIEDLVKSAKSDDTVLIVVTHEQKFAPYFDEVIHIGGESRA